MDGLGWLKGLLALLLFLLLVWLLRLRFGLFLRCAEGDLTVRLRLGWHTKQLYPKRTKPQTETSEESVSDTGDTDGKRPSAKQLRQGIGELYPLLCRALRYTRRRVRVEPCCLAVVFGGTEPDEVARRYGRAEVLLWSVMPQLEQLLTIPNPSIQLNWDFDAEQTQAEGELGFSVRTTDLLWLAVCTGFPFLRWLVRIRRENRTTSV